MTIEDVDDGGVRGWTEPNLSWMSMWARQISFTQEAYIRAARFWQRVYYTLCIVALAFTALSGMVQVPTIGACPIGEPAACMVLQWFSVACAAVATLVGGVNSLLGANSTSAQCRETADSLRKLASDIDLVVRCAMDRRPAQYEYSQLVLERYTAVLDKAPTLLRRHSLESTALPNRTLVDIYVENADSMHSLQELHIHPPAPAPSAPIAREPPTALADDKETIAPPPLLVQKNKPQPPTVVMNMSNEDKRMMHQIQDQLKRLDEHVRS